MKKYAINDDPFYQRNGCQWVEIKCSALHLSYVKKLFGHFTTHYLSEIFDHHALFHEHTERPSGRDMVVRQR